MRFLLFSIVLSSFFIICANFFRWHVRRSLTSFETMVGKPPLRRLLFDLFCLLLSICCLMDFHMEISTSSRIFSLIFASSTIINFQNTECSKDFMHNSMFSSFFRRCATPAEVQNCFLVVCCRCPPDCQLKGLVHFVHTQNYSFEIVLKTIIVGFVLVSIMIAGTMCPAISRSTCLRSD